MKNKKVILAGALICAAGLCTAGLALPSSPLNLASVVQADDALYEGFFYKIQDGKAIITGCSDTVDLKDVVIPSVIKDGDKEYPVTNIGEKAFYKSKALKITVSDSVEQIGAYAFAQCTELKELDLGKNVRIIGDGAVGSYRKYDSQYETSYKMDLDKLILPDNASSIGKEIFSENPDGNVYTDYKELVVRDSVEFIDPVFYNVWHLHEINAAENGAAYSSDKGVLYNKDKTELIRCPISSDLTEYVLADSVKTIDDKAFYNCWNLTSLSVNDNAETIGAAAFGLCKGLKELYLGKNVKVIGDAAIGSYRKYDSQYETSYQINLDRLTLPDNLSSIGKSIYSTNPDGGVFTSVKELVIPESVTYIDQQFYQKNTLTEINVDENNTTYSSDCGVLYNKDKTELIRCPQSTALLEYNLNEAVKTIDDKAFYWCSNIKVLNVNDNAETIGDYAFARCTALKELNLGKNVMLIGKSAIGSYRKYDSQYETSYKISLSKLTLPDNILSVGDDLFSENPDGNVYTSFNELIIPASVTAIDPVFYHESTLANINVSADNTVYSSDNGILFNKAQTELIRCPQSTTLLKYDIPSTVTEIAPKAFYWCTAIKSVDVDDNAESIGESAFARCTSLKELKLGKNVTKIEKNAIGSYRKYDSRYETAYQTNLDKLTLSDNIQELGDDIFSENPSGGIYTQVKELIVPATATAVPPVLFTIPSLTNITVEEGNQVYYSNLGVVYTADKSELIKCPQSSSLIKFEVDNATGTINDSAFTGTKIMNITIPGGVTKIGEDVFTDSALKIISGAAGSYAETYAAQNKYTFNAIAGMTVPATTEPAATEPAATEPAATEPAVTEPAVTEPAVTEPAVTEPAMTEPAVTEPAVTEPAVTEPAVTEPAMTEPAVTEPAVTEPAVNTDEPVQVTTSVTSDVTAPVTTTAVVSDVTAPLTTTAVVSDVTAPLTTTAVVSDSAAPVTTTAVVSDVTAPLTTTAAPETAPTVVPGDRPSTLPSAMPTKTPALPATGVDVDGDGKVSTSDVRFILKSIVGSVTPTEEQKKASDINNDGAVNTADALLLLRTIAGISAK